MNLSPYRKMMDDLRGKLDGYQAEIARLEAERDHLLEAAINFDDWKLKMAESIDAQADAVGPFIVASHTNRLALMNAFDLIRWPIQRFGTPEAIKTHSPFIGEVKHSSLPDAGLWNGVLLLLFRNELKALFLEKIEPLRASWPDESECGPPFAERISRLDEINARLMALITEREEARAILRDSTGEQREVLNNGS